MKLVSNENRAGPGQGPATGWISLEMKPDDDILKDDILEDDSFEDDILEDDI